MGTPTAVTRAVSGGLERSPASNRKTSIESMISTMPDLTRCNSAMGPAENDDKMEDSADDYDRMFAAIHDIIGYIDEDTHAPIVLELLLQRAAQTWPGSARGEVVPGSSGALVSSLLWQHCGWDSPTGRKLIRRLCMAFNRYAEQGVMPKESFIQLAQDAGWVTKRDMSARFSRLAQAFTDIVGSDSQSAEFSEFVLL